MRYLCDYVELMKQEKSRVEHDRLHVTETISGNDEVVDKVYHLTTNEEDVQPLSSHNAQLESLQAADKTAKTFKTFTVHSVHWDDKKCIDNP